MNTEVKTFLLSFAGALAALFAFAYLANEMNKMKAQPTAGMTASAGPVSSMQAAANGFFA